jgi:23S rRNA (uracil1939-C5)-methyltransferase
VSIVVDLFALAHGGASIGSIVEGPPELIGKKAFVRDTIPGERVTAEIVKDDKSFVTANLVSIGTPSSARMTPRCAYVGTCGGCDLQHMSIEKQREAKRHMVETTLARHAKVEPRCGVKLRGHQLPAFSYRKRIALHLDEAGQLGFYRRGSGAVVDIDSCALAVEPINKVMQRLRTVSTNLTRYVEGVVLEDRADDVGVLLKLRPGAPLSFPELAVVREVFPALQIEESGFAPEDGDQQGDDALGHFSQVNALGNQELVAEVLERAHGDELTELYAGSGNFTLPLAKRGAAVTAVESDPLLVKLGTKLAALDGLSERIRFVQDSCERFVRRHELKPTVLLDPPRSGARGILSAIKPALTKRIVYVSCSVPTLSRDLKQLTEMGYSTESVTVIDMFAQTHHIETVTTLIA